MDLKPVGRTTTAQSVASQILEMIRSGAIRPGDQLPPEKDLMDKMKVGRSTIREALQILATLNVVQASVGHGTFVKQPSARELFRPDLVGLLIANDVALELLEAREMIEPQTVRLAAIRGSDEDFDAIDRLLDAHEAALARGGSVTEHAARFHVMLAEASKNRVALSFMTSILDVLMQRGRRLEGIPDFQAREIVQHRAILDMVRARDPERAAEMMLEHIVESATTYDRAGATGGHPLLPPEKAPLP